MEHNPFDHSVPVYSREDQLQPDAYIPYWVAKLPIGRHPPHPAPPTQNACREDQMNSFPLQNSGSVDYINPSVLYRSSFEAVASSDRGPCLDETLDNSGLGQDNHSIGIHTSTRSQQAYNTRAPINPISSTYLLQGSHQYIPELYSFPAMSSNTSRRDHVRHSSHQSPCANPPHQENGPLRSTQATSVGKRNLDTTARSPSRSSDSVQRPTKLPRVNHAHEQERKSNSYNHIRSNRLSSRHEPYLGGRMQNLSHTQGRIYKLKEEQKDFIRHWFRSIARGQDKPYLATEEIDAFATLVKAPPQAIWEYVQKRLNSTKGIGQSASSIVSTHGRIGTEDVVHQSYSTYTLREANKHLDSATLDSIEKYVSASQRRRTQSDGRRSVNQGPYRCTFGCGYCTKRTFDWRRHEETHEPQELWLCHFCKQRGDVNPFLVNRKDKFLQHVKDSHVGRDTEDVLEISTIDFRAKFNPQCTICSHTLQTWDERCKHVLQHYEDEIYAKKAQQAREVSSPESGSVSEEHSFQPDSFTPSSSSSNEDEIDRLVSRRYSPSYGQENDGVAVMLENSVRSQLGPSC